MHGHKIPHLTATLILFTSVPACFPLSNNGVSFSSSGSGSSILLDCKKNAATDCLTNTSYVAGRLQTPSSPSYTSSGTTLTVAPPQGYFDGFTALTLTDANLNSNNILSGSSIFGVTGNNAVVNTSSATAVAAGLLAGKTAFVNGNLVTGTLPNQGTLDASIAWPGLGYYAASINNAPTASQLCLGATSFGVVGTQICYQQFSATGSMATARYAHIATVLPNGKVLIAAGYNAGSFLTTATLYDPNTGLFTATGSMATGRNLPTVNLLPNGKVLIAGGYNGAAVASAEVYDPNVGTFTATGSMSTGRQVHTATLLPNGKVLITGGNTAGGATASAELYDPNTGTFTATGSMTWARQYHAATLLPNGKVLITGGTNGMWLAPIGELYDPNTGTFTATGSMVTPRTDHTSTLLPNGKVLIAGGSTLLAELYDPSLGTFAATGSLVTGLYRSATLLPTGKVLIAGGNSSSASATLYDPNTGTFTATGSMTTGRYYHTATLLPNGKVLMTGGVNGPILASAELFY